MLKFVNSLYRRSIQWLMTTSFYSYLMIHVVPYIRFTTYYTSLRGWKYHKMYNKLKPGDVILTLDKKKLTSLLIPGNFSHAAMCVSKDERWEISEMTHTNYTLSTFFDICKESDRVVILRCMEATQDQINKAIDKCKSFRNAKYDLNFSLGVESLYCSELVYQSYENNLLKADLTDLVGLGRPYISPDGLYIAKNLYVVADSDNYEI